MDLHANSLAFFRYWDGRRGDRRMPARADFDPLEIPQLMRYLSLLDILPTEPRFRYRLVGTGIVEYFGRNSTGWFVDEKAYGPGLADVLAFYGRGADGMPVRAVWSGRLTPKFSGRFETLVLPLGKNHETADMLVTLTTRLGPPAVAGETGDPLFLRSESGTEGAPFEVLEVNTLDTLKHPG